MKYYLLPLFLSLVVAGCAPAQIVNPEFTKEPPCKLKGGVVEPDMNQPPYCWVSPPGDKLWYPCGQCLSDEEIGKHGH